MYQDLLEKIEKLTKLERPVVVAICGYGGSGKSYLAEKIAKSFDITDRQILHMDYLHPSPDIKVNKDDIFSDHDWPLIYRILKDVRAGKRLQYKSMGLWGHTNDFDEPAPKVLIVEGVRLLRKEVMQLLDVSVWIDAPVSFVTERAKNRDREMATYGQEIFLKAEKKGPLTDKAYLQALEKNHRLTRTEGIDAVMARHKLDAIVSPTTGPASVIDQLNGEKYFGSTTTLAAVAGYPHITLPSGFVSELPVGISFFGRAWSEPTLIKLAFAFEQATKVRKPPKFLPTLKLV